VAGSTTARLNLALVDRLEGDEAAETGDAARSHQLWSRASQAFSTACAETVTGTEGVRARAAAHLGLAAARLRLGQPAEAQLAGEGALDLYRKAGSQLGEARALSTKGTCLTAQGRRAESVPLLEQACSLVERLRAEQLGLRERSGFFEQSAFVFENLIDTLVGLDRREEALAAVERAKARGLLDLMEAVGGTSRTESLTATVSVSSVQRELGTTSALLEFYVGHGGAYGLAVTSAGLTVRKLARSPAWLFERVQGLLEALQPERARVQLRALLESPDFEGDRYERQQRELWAAFRADVTARCRELYDVLLVPFEPELSLTRSLGIVPHGILHHLPFAALLDATTPAPLTVLDRWALWYAPSAGGWLRSRERGRQAGPPRRILLMTSPDFPPGFAPLAGATEEGERLAGLFRAHGASVDLLTGAAASESALADRWGRHELVHLATHGQLNPTDPLESRVLLSPGNGRDGSLLVREVLQMRSPGPTPLVVLSACETGQLGTYDEDAGRRFPIGDDLLGLTRAFEVAGAARVLASFWKVDDDATSQLLQEFYKSWLAHPGDGVPRALRQAQLSLRRVPVDSEPDSWDLPYYWAAFAVHGAGP
jgi:CHAT domain-containing protein